MSKALKKKPGSRRPESVKRFAWVWKTALGVGVCLALAWGGIWGIQTLSLFYQPFLQRMGFQVQEIQIEGRQRTSQGLLLKMIGLKRGDSLFQVSPWELKKRLERLPWVRSAVVERSWPWGFYIRLAERQPLAFWQNQGEKFLIDGQGTVITCHVDGFEGALITVLGANAPKASPQLIDLLKQFPGLLERVRAAVCLRSGRWELHLQNHVILRLPALSEAAAPLKRLLALEAQDRFRFNGFSVIDLRFEDRLILTPHPSKNLEKVNVL